MKPGLKTSEFWAVLAAIGGTTWTFAQQNCDLSTDKLFALAMTLLAAIYAALRTWLKVKGV